MSQDFPSAVENQEQVPPDEAAEFTLEDLFNEGINEEQVNQGAKDMALPNGTYTTVTPFQPKLGTDKVHPDRKIVSFWGGIELADVKGKIGFRISNTRFNKLDADTGADTGKPDMAYKLYVMAVKAFKVAYGAEPASFGDVITYIRDYPVKLRLVQASDGGNIVVSISPIKPAV